MPRSHAAFYVQTARRAAVVTMHYRALSSLRTHVQVYIDTAAKDGISLESPCHAVREFQITGLVSTSPPPSTHTCTHYHRTSMICPLNIKPAAPAFVFAHILPWGVLSCCTAYGTLNVSSGSRWHLGFEHAPMFNILQAGDYRRLLHKAGELEWALLQYADPDAALTASDSALAEGAPKPLASAPRSRDHHPLAALHATDISIQILHWHPIRCCSEPLVRNEPVFLAARVHGRQSLRFWHHHARPGAQHVRSIPGI